MKVRCGRCGAEYSEIRRVCPKCSEDTKYAIYIEGASQGRTIFDTNRDYGGRSEEEQSVESMEDDALEELEQLQIPMQPTKTEKGMTREKRTPIFLILFLVGLVVLAGVQVFENYRKDYQVTSWTKEIPVEKIKINEKVDLGYNSFTILGIEEVENDVIKKYIPENKKIMAVAIKAVEEKYTEKAKNLYASAFYSYYNGDEYIQCIQSSSILSLLELEGYLSYYGPSSYDEPGYMFFLVDQDVKEMTLVYALENQSFMLGEYIEKFYEIKLEVE